MSKVGPTRLGLYKLFNLYIVGMLFAFKILLPILVINLA
ncbi:hypothetical protein PESP_a2718 [Pseudoalteromonas espejiana DSM 9414]|nr:hypothetical protein PESP_a2718 [Pseudoalteromonas espejiana DSM 9414]